MQKIIIASLFLLATLAVSSWSQTAAPTIEFLIRAPTIEEFRKKALPQLVSAMGSIDIPPIEQDHLKVTNIVQSNMQLDTANMKINFEAPNFVRLSVNLGMDLRADYEAGWSLLKTRGTVNAKLLNTNLNARLELFLNDNTKKFNVRFSDVDMKVGELDIQLTGDLLAKIANVLKGLFSGLIKSEVQKKTASTLYGIVTDQLNEYLIEAPNVIPLASTPFSLDYQPIASPAITPNEIVLSLSAYLYEQSKGSTRPPINAPSPLPSIPKDAENVYLTLSEYIFDSIAFSIFDSGFLKLNLTNSQIPKEVPIKMTTKLFEGLFEGLETLYPTERNVSLTCYPYAKPNIDLNEKNLTAEVYGACDFLVEGENSKLASLEVNIATSLDLFIEANSIKGKFIAGACRSVKIISSQLKADEEGLRGLLDFGIKLGLPVVGKMVLNKGIPIPAVPGVEIKNTQLAFRKGAVVVQTTPDFTNMDDKTKEILVEMTKKSIAQFIKDLYKRMFP